MTAKKNTKSAAPAAKSASKAKQAKAPSRKPAAKAKAAGVKTAKPVAKSAAPAKKRAPAAKKAPAKTKVPAAKSKKRAPKVEQEAAHRIGEPVLDPIGDVTSGEGQVDLGDADSQAHEAQAPAEIGAFQKATQVEASDAVLEAGPGLVAAQAAIEARGRRAAEDQDPAETDRAGTERGENDETEPAAEGREKAKRAPAKLERLQKILSAAGIASRRSAEEMIVAGRVIVNGQVVTQLGSKADAARDHIRVDGKLLHGAERHRYFVLNKPRGYVTTMSDPEGRPTVMEFFAGARERVYPVGRLDYLSEGLLLMTNDGELANLLTKAGSGVEKTYLVKVAGEPTAEELERLRGGVAIEKGEPGSERVRTAPARIRQVREGDNPWFEVALIEGRNRELRKMFSAIGHFAEKIRRVGYGPLVLDLEPGKIRELDEDEVKALRLTAEGKMKPRRTKATKMLPRDAGVPAEQRAEKRGGRGGKDFSRRAAPRPDSRFARSQVRSGPSDRRTERPGAASDKPRWNREDRGSKKEWRPRSEEPRGESRGRPSYRPAPRQDRGENPFDSAPRGPFQPRSDRPSFRPAPRQDRVEKPFGAAPRAPFNPRTERPEFRPAPRQERGERPIGGAQRGPFKPRGERPFGSAPRGPFNPRTERPEWKRDDAPKPRLEVERIAGPQEGASFGGGKPKPSFGRKPGFGGKPGGSGKYRGNTRGGPKRSFSRPGAPRGGRKRG